LRLVKHKGCGGAFHKDLCSIAAIAIAIAIVVVFELHLHNRYADGGPGGCQRDLSAGRSQIGWAQNRTLRHSCNCHCCLCVIAVLVGASMEFDGIVAASLLAPLRLG